VISIGISQKDPYILSVEELNDPSNEVQFNPQLHASFLRALKGLENFQGRIKFQSRYGKTVFYGLSDEAKMQPFVAESLIQHMENNPSYRSSFCTGTKVMPDLHEELGEPNFKESYNFKTLVKHEGKYYDMNLSCYVRNEESLVCESVSGKERKLLLIDHISIAQNKLDLRFALQVAEYIQEDHFLFPYARQLLDSLRLSYSSGKQELIFESPPDMYIHMLRHKKRYSYQYERLCKIDIANVELMDMQSEVFNPPTGVRTALFPQTKTEVEVSLIPWRKAFKFNKCMAGGQLGEHLRASNPQEWSAEELLQDLERLIEVSKSVSDLIFPID